MRSPDIPLHDIAPLAEVSDYSLYYFLGLLLVASALIAAIVLWWIKRRRNRCPDPRKTALERLRTVDLSDPKTAAYAISEIGRIFAADNERTRKAYENLFERLERYKYAPRVDAIDEETIGYYRLYLEIIDA